MAMFRLLKIRTGIDIFKNEKCKVTFGLEYRKSSSTVFFFWLLSGWWLERVVIMGQLQCNMRDGTDGKTKGLLEP